VLCREGVRAFRTTTFIFLQPLQLYGCCAVEEYSFMNNETTMAFLMGVQMGLLCQLEDVSESYDPVSSDPERGSASEEDCDVCRFE
jgi:hypothetical protein